MIALIFGVVLQKQVGGKVDKDQTSNPTLLDLKGNRLNLNLRHSLDVIQIIKCARESAARVVLRA